MGSTGGIAASMSSGHLADANAAALKRLINYSVVSAAKNIRAFQ